MTDDFHGRVVEFHLCGGPIEDWMEIPYISVPLERLYEVDEGSHILIPVERWRELIMLPKLLHVLEVYCEELRVDDFYTFTADCENLTNPSSALTFSPPERPMQFLNANDLHAFINARAALTAAPVRLQEPHCIVNVRFVGVSARRLRLLLKDVVRPSSSGSRRSPSPVHSTLPTAQETPAIQTFKTDGRLQTTDVARRAYSPARGYLSAVHVSPDDADSDEDGQDEMSKMRNTKVAS
jgi:hypothetical protein